MPGYWYRCSALPYLYRYEYGRCLNKLKGAFMMLLLAVSATLSDNTSSPIAVLQCQWYGHGGSARTNRRDVPTSSTPSLARYDSGAA